MTLPPRVVVNFVRAAVALLKMRWRRMQHVLVVFLKGR
jgi:hypothetical protein